MRQSVREDQGIAQQIAECERHAEAEKWRVVDVYRDNFTSATKERGPGTAWARMLADIDAGRIDTVLVVAVDRLMRRLVDVLEVHPPRRNVRVVVVRGGIDTSDPSGMGGFILGLFVLVADQEIRRKEARAIPYRAARHEAGHPSPGLVPFGYTWVPALQRDERGTRYAVVPAEAEILRFMSAELLGGASLGGIVRELNERGMTTREGVAWTTTTARRALISPFPAALLPAPMPEGERYSAAKLDMTKCTPGAWDAILTADEVLAARHKLLDPSRRNHDGHTRAKWLLAGVGRCGKCKGPLRSCMTKTTATSVRGYRCTAGCFQRPAAPIEAYIGEAVVGVLSAPGVLQHEPDDEHDIGKLRGRQRVLRGEREEAEALYRDDEISATTLRVKTGRIDAALAEIDAALAAALAVDPVAEIVTSGDVRGMWEGMTTERRRAVLGALVHHVEVLPVGKGRRIVTVEQTEGTVVMGWKRAQRRVAFDRARTVTETTPRVPFGAEDEISAALNA